jgi:hypothetical protein
MNVISIIMEFSKLTLTLGKHSVGDKFPAKDAHWVAGKHVTVPYKSLRSASARQGVEEETEGRLLTK